jgi:hypothetical protein
MKPIWNGTVVTPDGTRADLAKSLLQKCIRRGRESNAVYYAKQCISAGRSEPSVVTFGDG